MGLNLTGARRLKALVSLRDVPRASRRPDVLVVAGVVCGEVGVDVVHCPHDMCTGSSVAFTLLSLSAARSSM